MTEPVVYSHEALAWAAGLFDGEGYIGCFIRKTPRGNENPILNMTVVQWHDPTVITRFQAALGGLGRIQVRTPKPDAIEYTWRVASFEKVQASVALIWRWLSGPKRQQAIRALNGYHQRRGYIGVRAWRRRRYGHE